MNKNIHTITANPENADKYSYMHTYIQPFSHKSKKCQGEEKEKRRKRAGEEKEKRGRREGEDGIVLNKLSP